MARLTLARKIAATPIAKPCASSNATTAATSDTGTWNDPRRYTKPFTIKFSQELQADSDIFENVCNENERDRSHRQN